MHKSDDEGQGKAKGGFARARALSTDRRREIARKAADARWGDDAPVATHDGDLQIGEATIFAAVLPDGTRVISQSTMLRALGRHAAPPAGQGGASTFDELPVFLNAEALKPFVSEDLAASSKPVLFKDCRGTKTVGYRASLLPEVAEVYLRFRDQCLRDGRDPPQRYKGMIAAADLLMRGLATVGIIALVDEATGYQRDRAKDALAKILEAFIAKELQPYLPTFPTDFYDQMFRLRGLTFPAVSVRRPQYFGMLTNDVVYKRLAPGVLDELKRVTPRNDEGRPTAKYFQSLTSNMGYPKLKEHLGAVVALMRVSKTWDGFMNLLDEHYPRHDKGPMLPMDYDQKRDDGKGI